MISAFGHDCLYYDTDETFISVTSIIPFCLRSETGKQFDDQDQSCYGNKLSFKQLKSNNISTKDLFWWNALIETIEFYEKYLLSDNLVDAKDQYYCNCSALSRFGKFCQYDIDTKGETRNLVELLQLDLRARPNEETDDYFTCYIGIRCQTNLFCLDWRQICNGIVDCDQGEDEPFDLCSQMEFNECDPKTQFRCQNGMCIPMFRAFEREGSCLDQSDGRASVTASASEYLFDLCLEYPSIACDGINHGWKQFACNNGQYISYEDLTSKTIKTNRKCANGHHRMYLRKIFSSIDEDPCWKAMICFTGFDYLYSHINCSRQNITKNIEEWCPDEYYFPPNPIVYSFVFFLYSKRNPFNRIDFSGPDYICYKKEYCQTNNFTTISKNNLECFTIDHTMFSWETFYKYTIYLFSACFNNFSSTDLNDRMFYRCNRSSTYLSIHRLKNRLNDCYFNDDEHPDIDLCSLKINNRFQCLTNPNECIQEIFVGDAQYDCLDRSDEYFFSQITRGNDGTDFRSWSKRTLPEIYPFNELCNNVINRHLFSLNSSETDETNCEYWPYSCYSVYTKCNQIWNCANGRDEILCEGKHYNDLIRKILRCNSNQYYCIQLINNYTDLNMSCISMNRTGDGVIDCIGGTDEQFTSPCLEKYPYDNGRRFLCMNTTVCITIDQVCDKNFDCPLGDDERICPWLVQNSSPTFSCNSTRLHSVVRCDSSFEYNQYCRMGEHLWFCDLAFKRRYVYSEPNIIYETYPPHDENAKSTVATSKTRTFSLINSDSELSLCNGGYMVRSSIENTKWYCFCTPSHYGDNCQYQAEHLIVSLEIKIAYPIETSTVFRLILYLFNEDNRILSHEEIVYQLNVQNDGYDDFVVYLMYERVTNLSLHQRSKSKLVRLDSYIVKPATVHYVSSWLFNVLFPFLPVNKLAVEIVLRNESFRVMYCKKRCGSHGKCMYYINMRHIEYCWCEHGWSGDRCQVKSPSDLCNERSCAAHAQCVILNEEKKQMKCICPLGRSGEQCYIKYNSCERSPCRDNHTCLPLDQRKFEYVCACGDSYEKGNCPSAPRYTFISITSNVIDLSIVPAIVVIFGFAADERFIPKTRILFKNIALPTTLKTRQLPDLGFVQIFQNHSSSVYYTLAINSRLESSLSNTSVITKNRCKNVTEIFNETILHQYSYLKRLKLYHLPCNRDHDLRCFFDEYRMCLCTKNHNSHCYFFNHEYGNCNYCQNGGLCLLEDPINGYWMFTCLCQKCSYGSLCQFSPESYSISMDMLIRTEIKTGNTSFNQQSIVIHLILITLIILLSFSLIFNTISIFVFANKKLRQVGCDLYLLHLAIVAEIGLILLFLRFVYTTMIQMFIVEDLLLVRVGCISLEYLLKMVPSLFDWLTVCIAVERAYTVIKDVHFTKIVAMKTLKISRWIVLVVYITNIVTTLHRPFHLILVDEPGFDGEPQGHPWCVLDFGLTSWNVYDKVINVCHLIMPFILNLLSIIIFILQRTNFELTSATRKTKASRYTIIKEQLLKYKSMLISTMSVSILEIPRLVLTFTLACIDKNWHRYMYLLGYLISFLPLVGLVFIYIIPSPKYNQQFKTIVGKLSCLYRVRR